MILPKTWRYRSLLILGLFLLGVAILVFRPGGPDAPFAPSAQFLPVTTTIPAQSPSLFERWVPYRWSWVWRLRDRLRGPRASILIDSAVIDCSGFDDIELTALLPKSALAETNDNQGMRGWVLDNTTLTSFKKLFPEKGAPLLMRPRVQTSHNVQSSMSFGQAVSVAGRQVQVGMRYDFFPHIQPGGIDGLSIITITEAVTNRSMVSTNRREVSIATNLATAVAWKIPHGAGFFLLGPAGSNGTRRIGMITTVTPVVPPK